MFRRSFLAAAAASLIAIAAPAHANTACEFESAPRVLMQDGDPHEVGSKLLQLWEVANHPVLWSETAPETGDYRRFRDELTQRKIDADPVRLLERSPTENNRMVMQNAGDWIRPAACLEMLLFGHQHGRLNILRRQASSRASFCDPLTGNACESTTIRSIMTASVEWTPS